MRAREIIGTEDCLVWDKIQTPQESQELHPDLTFSNTASRSCSESFLIFLLFLIKNVFLGILGCFLVILTHFVSKYYRKSTNLTFCVAFAGIYYWGTKGRQVWL